MDASDRVRSFASVQGNSIHFRWLHRVYPVVRLRSTSGFGLRSHRPPDPDYPWMSCCRKAVPELIAREFLPCWSFAMAVMNPACWKARCSTASMHDLCEEVNLALVRNDSYYYAVSEVVVSTIRILPLPVEPVHRYYSWTRIRTCYRRSFAVGVQNGRTGSYVMMVPGGTELWFSVQFERRSSLFATASQI